jgi:hypothetical protein
MSEDQQSTAPAADAGISKFLPFPEGMRMKYALWIAKCLFRAAIVMSLLAPPILAGLAGWAVRGLDGIAPALWETLAAYVEVYGLIGFAIIAVAIMAGKFDEISAVKDFQSYVNSLILATIVALIHYQPLFASHR